MNEFFRGQTLAGAVLGVVLIVIALVGGKPLLILVGIAIVLGGLVGARLNRGG